MEIIPVIDLMHGQVVRARRGERHRYQPMVSRLCSGSQPLDIVAALLALYPFTALYIADLDAILRRGDHRATIAAIRARHPQLQLWVDAGFSTPQQLDAWQALDIRAVLGSENLPTRQHYDVLRDHLDPATPRLSLDFSATAFLGDPALLADSAAWPSSVIAMTLASVGSQQGPDWDRIADIVQRAGERQVIAAGGVRHLADLQRLAQAGCAGALIASALHDGHISADALARNRCKTGV